MSTSIRKKDTVVSNTSPLISLVECLPNGGSLLGQIFYKVLIPRQVLDELIQGTPFTHENYLKHYGIQSVIEVHEIELNSHIPEIEKLDEGEAYAISLAVKQDSLLMIDEKKGRRIASENALLRIEYCTDQIIYAYEQGIIHLEQAKLYLDTLLNVRIGPKLYEHCLKTLNYTDNPLK